MFEKIHKNKLSGILLWKYIFQIFLFPLLIAIIVYFFIVIVVPETFQKYEQTEVIGCVILLGLICNSYNILSSFPFILLLIDNITGNKVKKEQFKIVGIDNQWELGSLLLKKRFIIDTFSKKKNDESWVRAETKNAKTKVFRFYWNESYGGNIEIVDNEFQNNTIYEFTYLKYSHVIVEMKKIDGMRTKENLLDYTRLREWNNHLPKKDEFFDWYHMYLTETNGYDKIDVNISIKDRNRNHRNFKKLLKKYDINLLTKDREKNLINFRKLLETENSEVNNHDSN